MSESKDVLEGFNTGYILKQKRPKLYQQLENAVGEVDTPFFKSFIEGGNEYTQERIRELMSRDINHNINQDSQSKDSPDNDFPEPDMPI